jgi:uncharacterized membrane protein YgcG
LIDEVLAAIDHPAAPTRGHRSFARSRRARVGSVAALVVIGLGAFGLTFAFGPSTGVSGVARASASVLGRQVPLPHGFRLVRTASSTCDPWAVSLDIRVPVDIARTSGLSTSLTAPANWTASGRGGRGQLWSRAVGNLVSGPSDKRGCIQSSRSAPYKLPAGVSPTTPFIPAGQGGSPTSIDGFYAEVVPITVSVANVPAARLNWIQLACGNSSSGPSGASGPPPAGSSGASGSSGPSGDSGAVGVSGPSGNFSSGPSGTSGSQVPVGPSGASGTSAPSGHGQNWTSSVAVPCGAKIRASRAVIPGTVIYVRVPATNGRYQLVTVIGWSMPASQLVNITAEALTPKG